MKVLALDVGGANIKAAALEVKKNRIIGLKTAKLYFPIWRRGKESLQRAIKDVTEKLGSEKFEAVGLTMTAELSDAYFTKREGVNHVIECVEKVFPKFPISVLNVKGELVTPETAKKGHLEVASANWVATGWLVANWYKNCIVIDVGSTTTSIIPVFNGKIVAKGKTDLEKLICGELVYTGSLRTNIATITKKVPVKGFFSRVSSEVFALSGDVHLLLGHISQESYSTETADGRGKTRKEAMARVARVICADLGMLNEGEIISICSYIYMEQINQIVEGLKQVSSRFAQVKNSKNPISIVTTGLGRSFLAGEAAKKAGFQKIITLPEKLKEAAFITAPVSGLALLTAVKEEIISGEEVKRRWSI